MGPKEYGGGVLRHTAVTILQSIECASIPCIELTVAPKSRHATRVAIM